MSKIDDIWFKDWKKDVIEKKKCPSCGHEMQPELNYKDFDSKFKNYFMHMFLNLYACKNSIETILQNVWYLIMHSIHAIIPIRHTSHEFLETKIIKKIFRIKQEP